VAEQNSMILEDSIDNGKAPGGRDEGKKEGQNNNAKNAGIMG